MTTTQETAVQEEQSGGSPTVEWVPVEPWPGPPPVPVLAPYLGLVAAVLCALGGGWLLLAPYALDFRHGAARVPRTTAVDLETGAAIVAVGIVTAVLFSAALVRRLKAVPDAYFDADAQPEALPEPQPDPEPEPEPVQSPHVHAQQADPGSGLRELLTPLVAALAADLRSHDQEQRYDQQQRHDQQHGATETEHPRQEP